MLQAGLVCYGGAREVWKAMVVLAVHNYRRRTNPSAASIGIGLPPEPSHSVLIGSISEPKHEHESEV